MCCSSCTPPFGTVCCAVLCARTQQPRLRKLPAWLAPLSHCLHAVVPVVLLPLFVSPSRFVCCAARSQEDAEEEEGHCRVKQQQQLTVAAVAAARGCTPLPVRVCACCCPGSRPHRQGGGAVVQRCCPGSVEHSVWRLSAGLHCVTCCTSLMRQPLGPLKKCINVLLLLQPPCPTHESRPVRPVLAPCSNTCTNEVTHSPTRGCFTTQHTQLRPQPNQHAQRGRGSEV